MQFSKPPYFLKNPAWYYHDPVEWRYKLTDKAPPKAVKSYHQFYADLEASRRIQIVPAESMEVTMPHKVIMIAAVDRNWAIGKNNKLLYNVPTDMQFFKEQTMGNIVVYGWKTLESFPGRRILPGRDNIILTSKTIACGDPRMYVAHSISDLSHLIQEKFQDERPVFICGGASVYEQFASIADEAYITKIDAATPDADAYFPNLDKMLNWEKRATILTSTDRESGLDLCFERYCRSETPFKHPKDK